MCLWQQRRNSETGRRAIKREGAKVRNRKLMEQARVGLGMLARPCILYVNYVGIAVVRWKCLHDSSTK